MNEGQLQDDVLLTENNCQVACKDFKKRRRLRVKAVLGKDALFVVFGSFVGAFVSFRS